MKISSTTKERFEVDGLCMDCQFKLFERLMEKFNVNYNDRQEFFGYYNLTIGRNPTLNMPQIHRLLNNEFCKIIGVEDPYVDEKKKSNETTLKLYNDFKTEVFESVNPFSGALRLSIAGNIMDYGAAGHFDIHETIKKAFETDFAIDHSAELEKRIRSSKKILYLGDNAGEIVFDKLFIEVIKHPQLTFAVRGGAVLNDATMVDAHEVGIDMVANVISNGYDAPSTVLTESSPEFLKLYNEADLIISKGQGNFEGLMDENDPRIFFLLMVKCDVVAERIGVDKGSFVVYNKTL